MGRDEARRAGVEDDKLQFRWLITVTFDVSGQKGQRRRPASSLAALRRMPCSKMRFSDTYGRMHALGLTCTLIHS